MNREIIMTALFNKLTAPPLVFNFTADTTTGDVTLANVSDATGLLVGMPIAGDGLPADVTIATVTPAVTVSLPAIADRTASPLTQGFQTAARRLRDPNAEQDMPALYLLELGEFHGARESNAPAIIQLDCQAWVYTRVGATESAIPAATLNALVDGIERALYPTPTGYRQNLGLHGVLYCRIEGEVQKDPGHNGQIASVTIPLRLVVAQNEDTRPIP
jgi:hypothetical protein